MRPKAGTEQLLLGGAFAAVAVAGAEGFAGNGGPASMAAIAGWAAALAGAVVGLAGHAHTARMLRRQRSVMAKAPATQAAAEPVRRHRAES
jgi:hypothetical protein